MNNKMNNIHNYKNSQKMMNSQMIKIYSQMNNMIKMYNMNNKIIMNVK